MNNGALIIGDELLSGKRQDKHLGELIRLLAMRGMRLHYAEYLGDDPERIAASLARAFASGDRVFSFGGIGATPDDHTRAAAARALGAPLELQPQAAALIEARFGDDARPNRIRMAEFPRGAAIIPNPVNTIAGFSVGHVHFVPGFPSMAWPMVEWVLDTHYRDAFNPDPDIEQTLVALDAREGDLIDLMEAYTARYPALRLSSLPSFGTEAIKTPHIEFGFTGQPALVGVALAEFARDLKARGYTLA
ncbi:competence/damage-inducible protein A [Paludibacterium paludis]|uniref:Damage-inducible protein n=1 Tax=Paludibacterium paludis TaxID=1225769 RepID=A0A918UB69_9NEIS|nr:molybdopterin-binding protein [Paludibacterium paludis]GGY21132.1 damage-inducible protein [Paludibacterium paludis]